MAKAWLPVYTGANPPNRIPTIFLAAPKRRARPRFRNILKRTPKENRTPPSPPCSGGLCTLPDATQDKLSPPTADRERPQPVKILPWIASLFQSVQPRQSGVERSINAMDETLEGGIVSDQERMELINKLCKTCSRQRLLPKSMHIPDCLNKSSKIRSYGGNADVWESTYKGRRVAVKVLRVSTTDGLDVIRSRFCREAVIWKHLKHPNVLPLLGVTVSEHRFAMISEWMENGNVNEFTEKDRRANRTEFLAGAANGLMYMHHLRLVHGDLKGANILVNRDRHACIADFGLSTITGVRTHSATRNSGIASPSSPPPNDSLVSFTPGWSIRWVSPELLDPGRFGVPESEDDRPTRESDCYAMGMVIYEVLCGHVPYPHIQRDVAVIGAILNGDRPKKPDDAALLGFTEELWETIERCWSEDRNARPGVEVIYSCLDDAVPLWQTRE